MRSRRVSPMPIKSPVVIGMPSSPAERSVSSRLAGTLSGEPKCGPPRAHKRSAALSSMMPIDTLTGLSRRISSARMTPAFRCGSNPVSSSTSLAMRSRYSSVLAAPAASSAARAAA